MILFQQVVQKIHMYSNEKQSILLVDDDSVNQDTIKMVLKDLDLNVVIAESTEQVAGLILVYDFALILFAVASSDTTPFEAAIALGHNEKTWYVPVIFQAEPEDFDELLLQGYAAGAVDFIQKPVREIAFFAKVKVFLELDARQRQLAFATNKIQEQNLKLEDRAIRDSLTGLYNHNYLLEQLNREVSLARRYNKPLSVFLLDLDFFKEVNDTCGHPFGDFVLKEFAERVRTNLRESDIFGRYGGEEFLIISPNIDRAQADVVAEKIRKEIAVTVFVNTRHSRYVTVSIGVYSGSGKKHASSRSIVDYVDNALYQAKAEGRNRACHYKIPKSNMLASDDHLRDLIGLSKQGQLNATIEKARAMTLASFEAMVHSQTREYDILMERNAIFLKVLDRLAKKLNLPDQLIHSFRRSIKLHDLFRCYIRDSSPKTEGPLSEEQEKMLFDQPLMLRELTTMFDFFASERVILYAHHEFYDGTGYPDGLKGNEIPMAARIFTLVDSFVAMVAPVSSKKGMNREEAEDELQKYSGHQFDPFLVDMLIQAIDGTDFFQKKKE
ncbi:MAG: diguanylate cyclase [Thermodesulfobacteriota bacterium]|nr:diguanylate cyclase [Thermodesulfobacteriota bacterium]